MPRLLPCSLLAALLSAAVAMAEDGALREKPITAEERAHWSFQPPKRPDVPSPEDRTWVRNPIDAFILSSLQTNGLKPAPEADRTTFLRRLSVDLIGLP